MRSLILSAVVLILPAMAVAQEPTQEEKDRQKSQEREMQQPQRERQDPLYEKESGKHTMTHQAGTKISCRADKLIGSNVKDTSGKQIGTIKDLAIDPGNGRLVYGVLSFGGFLGMGDKYFAIPWGALECQSDNTFQLDVTEAQLKEMEGFDKNNWPDMANPRWATAAHQRFGQRPYWETHDPAEKHPIDQPLGSEREMRTEREPMEQTEPMERPQPGRIETLSTAPRIIQGTQLIGASVKDNKQEAVGNVKDLLVDTQNSRVSCAVLSFGGFLGMGDKLVAVPFQKMTIQPKTDDSTEPRDIDSVVVNVDKEQLKNAPSFTDSSWPRDDDREYLVTVYRFYNVPTYW